MQPLPIFGTGLQSIAPAITAQKRLNVYFDARTDNDKTTIVCIGTNGSVFWGSVPNSPIRGWRVVNNFLYVVAGNSVYKVTTSGITSLLGTISTSVNKVQLSDNYVQLLIVDGSKGYAYTIVTGSYAQAGLNAAGSFGQITDVNFPVNPVSIDFTDGWFIVVQGGSRQAWLSGSYDGTNWTPISYFTKSSASDLLLAVQCLNGLIFIQGVSTFEVWQNVGAATFPLARIAGATQAFGLAAVSSRAVINSCVVFLGYNLQGQAQVVQLVNGYSPQVISTPDLDGIIDEISDNFIINDAVGFSYPCNGHIMYQLTFPSGNASFLYDATTNIWSELQTGLGLQGRHIAELGINYNNQTYITDSSTGNIYNFDDDVYTDNGVPIVRQVCSKHIVGSGNTITISELCLDMQLGVGLEIGQGSNPQISVETSKDGGNTYGTPRLTSIGKVGQYRSPRAYWKRFGKSKDFVFRFTMTDPVQFVIAQAYGDIY